MKSILIAEDEKLIRQGLKAMVRRSGVPVEIILECRDGKEAFEIIQNQHVDVLFTDIQMPHMTGIELVHAIQELNDRPVVVAISGYDDFDYAVEMLRNGAKEYILKPVKRDKLTEVLQNLEEELNEKAHQKNMEQGFGKSQLRHLLTNDVTDEEKTLILEKNESEFFKNGYQLCVAESFHPDQPSSCAWLIDHLDPFNVSIISAEKTEEYVRETLPDKNAGISPVYNSLADIRDAYISAIRARKAAFYLNKGNITKIPNDRIPEQIRKDCLATLTEEEWMKRVHLLGTNKSDEINKQWDKLIYEMKKLHIYPDEFEKGVYFFLEKMQEVYSKFLTDQQKEEIAECKNIYTFSCFDDYAVRLRKLIMEVNNAIAGEEGALGSREKIRRAIEYMNAHYSEDLNMAIISNYVSMNYTLFSVEFKNYTGTKFNTFLKTIRIEKAKKLLEETDYRIIEISSMVGFESEKHFMRTFKEMCGVSPGEYRKIKNN